MMDHLLNAEVMLPAAPRALRPAQRAIARTLRYATIATMPRWMRKMGGLRQSRVIDASIAPVMQVSFRLADAHPPTAVRMLRLLSPSTVTVAAPALLGLSPRRRETLTPAQARERYGILAPTEEYARFRERVAAKAAGGDASDDAAVVAAARREEYEAVLGPVA
jgi:hypothetical protein